METEVLPRVLCVDDEPQILEGLKLVLRKSFEVRTATSGEEALRQMDDNGPFTVILSDMRMPGVNGTQFLAEARARDPLAVRILLTGHADIEAAISAINEGWVFRFLLKPCERTALRLAFSDALRYHQLVASEKVLLEQTLRGAVEALMDVLSISHPLAAARSQRAAELVASMAESMDLQDRWEVDLAAILCHVGGLLLDPSTLGRFYRGEPLEPKQAAEIDRLPHLAQRLLGHIPRMEGVTGIITRSADRPLPDIKDRLTPSQLAHYRGAMALRAANAYVGLIVNNVGPAEAIHLLERDRKEHDPEALVHLAKVVGRAERESGLRDVPVLALEEGMVLAEDLRYDNGVLLIAKGCTVGRSLMVRLSNVMGRMAAKTVKVRTNEHLAA